MSVRVDLDLKRDVDQVLAPIGVSMTQAITMLFHQIVLRGGLPFDVRIPPCGPRKARRAHDDSAKRQPEAGRRRRMLIGKHER